MKKSDVQVTGVPDKDVKKELIARDSIRWMMVIYDVLIYSLCWVAIFLFHPSMKDPLPFSVSVLYYFLGTGLFFSFRLLLKSYKRILRYGTIFAFSREILAGLLAGSSFVLIGFFFSKLLSLFAVPFVSLVSFAAVYIVVSMLARFVYCYLYRFAEKDYLLSKVVKRFLEIFAFVDFDSIKPGATLHLVLEPEKGGSGPINDLQNIIDQFAIRGDVKKISQLNKGYINRTYRVETLSDSGHTHKYTLQRINTKVFPDVDALMENFKLTTNHLYGKLQLPGHRKTGSVQTFRPTKDGRSYLKDESGCWRMLTYFENVYSMDIPDSPETFYRSGHAFGSFLKEMSDIDVDEIKVVIPNFHNTSSRYKDLEEAIRLDVKGRVKGVQREIEFVRSRSSKFGLISDALEQGKIPVRICHNDCNLNNILFDNVTHLPVAIIDLDTVMPSSPLYDFGDSMRIGTNTSKDDEKDLSKVSCNLHLYEKYARGYLEACGDILTEEELKLLPYAALIITAEDGIRFLMDHINGDTYYNIYYPGQNLDRARTQLKLLEDMEKKLPEIKSILSKIYADLGLYAEIK